MAMHSICGGNWVVWGWIRGNGCCFSGLSHELNVEVLQNEAFT
jgi:hypothetical protein